MNVNIRDAAADDAPFLAWVSLAATRSHLPRGVWEYVNGQDEATTLRFLEGLALSDEVHGFHASRFLVAEVGGLPAAGLCGYDPRVHGSQAMQPAFVRAHRAVGTSPEQFEGIATRGALLERVSPPNATGGWVVENVATRPEFRRRGIVAALLEAILERGRDAGFSCAQISILIGNEPARSAYLGQGFVPEDERRDPDFERALGTPGIERLLRPL